MVPVNFVVNVLKNMNDKIEKPNAFAFKARVNDTQDIQLCICIRENNQPLEVAALTVPTLVTFVVVAPS